MIKNRVRLWWGATQPPTSKDLWYVLLQKSAERLCDKVPDKEMIGPARERFAFPPSVFHLESSYKLLNLLRLDLSFPMTFRARKQKVTSCSKAVVAIRRGEGDGAALSFPRNIDFLDARQSRFVQSMDPDKEQKLGHTISKNVCHETP